MSRFLGAGFVAASSGWDADGHDGDGGAGVRQTAPLGRLLAFVVACGGPAAAAAAAARSVVDVDSAAAFDVVACSYSAPAAAGAARHIRRVSIVHLPSCVSYGINIHTRYYIDADNTRYIV